MPGSLEGAEEADGWPACPQRCLPSSEQTPGALSRPQVWPRVRGPTPRPPVGEQDEGGPWALTGQPWAALGL